MTIKRTNGENVMQNVTERLFRRQTGNVVTMPRLMFAPETVVVDLVYPDVAYSRNNVSSTFLSWRYRANSIYDPDPALGSGSVPGYTFWASGYNAYVVLGLGYDISISNMEGSAVDVVAWPTVTDVGLNYAGTGEMFGNPHASQNTVSAKGGMDRCRLRGTVDLGKFYGNPTQYISSFGGTFGANPVPIYFNVGGVSPGAFTSGNGLDVRVTLTYRVAIFSRKFLVI